MLSKSLCELLTVAVFPTEPCCVGVTLIVTTALAPTASVPTLQFTIPVPPQTPCVVATEPKVSPAGKLSTTTTLLAVAGPLFVATMRYESVNPTWAGLGDPVFTIETSALPELTTWSVAFVESFIAPDWPLMLNC